MKFIVSSSALSKQLSIISGVIVNNPVVPILENFLVRVSGKTLEVTASDLHSSITATLNVEAQEDAQIAMPARILQDTLKNLPDQPVTFSIDPQTYSVEISANTGHYRLACENATDFPSMAPIQDGLRLNILSPVLKKAIQQTLVATSTDELRPSLNGVYVDFKEENTTFVSTDTHRMVRYIRSDVGTTTQHPIILPRKTLTLLNGLLAQDSQATQIHFNKSHICFSCSGWSMMSRLIDERFPDYENVIPNNNPNKLEIHRMDLLSSLKRMAIYANKTTHQVRFTLTNSSVQISAEDFDFSNEASEQLKCTYEGNDLIIGFNVKMLIELTGNLSAETLDIYLDDQSKPVVIIPRGESKDESTLVIIMPVILSKQNF